LTVKYLNGVIKNVPYLRDASTETAILKKSGKEGVSTKKQITRIKIMIAKKAILNTHTLSTAFLQDHQDYEQSYDRPPFSKNTLSHNQKQNQLSLVLF
jgi:hypothetical protein